MDMAKNIGIVGATGYTGEELLRVLQRHSGAKVKWVTSEREAGTPAQEIYPHLPTYHHLTFLAAEDAKEIDVDFVFLCLPAGKSAPLAQHFFDRHIKVVDLGADFRFRDPVAYEVWYHMGHPAPELLDKAAYGLTEWYHKEIRDAMIVGNPGCYPTSVLLALLPLAQAGLLSDVPIIVDAKSGVSGAGKTLNPNTHFCAANENLTPYKPGRVHRHVGEMEQEVAASAGSPKSIVFTPHLTPLTRGLLSTMYVQLMEKKSKQELLDIFNDVYADKAFVHVLDNMPSMAMARNTNYCFIGAEPVADTNGVLLFSALDNLSKGASTQAVQNMNLMLNFEESESLL